ncbi:MAG: caspase family protein [Elusimicrobiota bacterium]
MKRVKGIIALWLSFSLICSCAGPPVRQLPQRETALPTKDLVLALVVTDKTKSSLEKVRASAGKALIRYVGGFDPNAPFKVVNSRLRDAFDSVVMVASVEQAKSEEADLIGILDMDARLKPLSMGKLILGVTVLLFFYFPLGQYINPTLAKFDGTLRFTDLDQKQLELIEFHALRKTGMNDPNDIWRRAVADIEYQIDAALARSRPLAEFAAESLEVEGANEGEESPTREAPGTGEIARLSDVDGPSYRSASRPDDFALVIGIEKYSHVSDARFAARDAQAMREHLVALGYPERNIILLTGERAGRSGIEKYVISWLPRNVTKDSRVFVYFAGHGAPDAGTKQAFLLPWDGDPQFLDKTGYPLKRLFAQLNRLQAKNVVLAMDTCFSGAGGRSVLPTGARPLMMEVAGDAVPDGKIVVMRAAADNEITDVLEAQSHGVFTYYLLRALNDMHGRASVMQVHESLLPRVQDAARRSNRTQNPRLSPSANGSRAEEQI